MVSRPFIILLLFFARVTPVNAQCLDARSAYLQLQQISQIPDNPTIIRDLRLLVAERRKCKLDDDSTFAKMLHVLGRTFWHEQKLDSAILFTREAIKINSSKSSKAKPANLCHSYYNLAKIYIDYGDLEKSLATLEKAINAGLQFKEKLGSVADSYSVKASIYTSLGDYEKTLFAADLGFKYAEKADLSDIMAKNLIEKAQASIELNNFILSDSLIASTLKLAQKSSNNSLLGNAYSLLAELRRKQNRPSEVIKCYQIAFKNYKAAQFDYGCGQVSTDLGYFYDHSMSNSGKALEQYNLALKYMPNDVVRAMITDFIGGIYRKQLEYDQALGYSQKALKLARLLVDKKNIEQNPSTSVVRNVLDKSAILAIIQNKADTWLSYAKYTKNDKPKLHNALKTYMLADTMIDFMRWEHSGNASKLFWREKTRAMYEHAIETCYLLNDPAKAFYFFEKSRAVLLNDQLNELGANQLLSTKEKEQENRLKRKVSDLQNQLSRIEMEDKNQLRIRSQLFKAQEELEMFIKHLETISPKYYAYKFDNHVPTIPEVRNNILAKDQTLLSYFVGDSAVYGMLLSHSKMALKKTSLPAYNSITSEFQTRIGNPDLQNREFGSYLKCSNQLYDLLIKPFNIDPGSRVIVSPDGSFLPFEALSTSPVYPDYLVKKFAFSYTYSISFIAKSPKVKSRELFARNFLGLAPVNFAKALSQSSLPGSDVEMKATKSRFMFSKIFTGNVATRHAFVENAKNYKVVQLLTHATADSTGTIPRLYFADSTLDLNELPVSEKSSTQLLILSACRTGIGKNQRGEGVFSLARGFAATGIPSTLITLWNVENESVYNLTQFFYDELQADLPLDIALQKAQNKWLATASKSEQLPYSWAGLVLVGNSEQIETGLAPLTKQLSSFAAFTTLLLVVFFVRRKAFKS